MLRTVSPRRILTYGQFEALGEDNLLRLLLTYRHHYLAFEVHRYLKKGDRFLLRVFSHWAGCKVWADQSI
jgi:hypothetical protein